MKVTAPLFRVGKILVATAREGCGVIRGSKSPPLDFVKSCHGILIDKRVLGDFL